MSLRLSWWSVVKNLCFHCRGHRFYPWLGNGCFTVTLVYSQNIPKKEKNSMSLMEETYRRRRVTSFKRFACIPTSLIPPCSELQRQGMELRLDCSGWFHFNQACVYPWPDSGHLKILASSPALGTRVLAGKYAVMTDGTCQLSVTSGMIWAVHH